MVSVLGSGTNGGGAALSIAKASRVGKHVSKVIGSVWFRNEGRMLLFIAWDEVVGSG
jgi:hypothetical protein